MRSKFKRIEKAGCGEAFADIFELHQFRKSFPEHGLRGRQAGQGAKTPYVCYGGSEHAGSRRGGGENFASRGMRGDCSLAKEQSPNSFSDS